MLMWHKLIHNDFSLLFNNRDVFYTGPSQNSYSADTPLHLKNLR